MKGKTVSLLSKFGVLLVLFLSTMSGCQGQDTSQESLKLSNEMSKSEAVIKQMEPVTNAVAIHNEKDKEVYAAAKVKHMDRLRLDKIRKDAHKQLSKEWPEWTVHFSTDKKAMIELQKLNRDMANKKMSDKEVKKRLTKIEEYMKG